jgi:predicted nucleic acid-binding protein
MSAEQGFVLDGSVTLAWYFADEADAYADEVGRQLPSVRAIVPTIWPLEVANAVLMGERRKRSTAAQAATWISYLLTLPITVDDETSAHALGTILSLSRMQGLSAYDAAYLDLAMRRGLPLASLDDRLKAAAAAVGVSLYVPRPGSRMP